MTTKKVGAKQRTPQSQEAARTEGMQTAYQVHTLAQMLYGHMATAYPWAVMPPPAIRHEPPMGYGMHPGGPQWPAIEHESMAMGPPQPPFFVPPGMTGFWRY